MTHARWNSFQSKGDLKSWPIPNFMLGLPSSRAFLLICFLTLILFKSGHATAVERERFAPFVSIAGAETTVFDWSRDRCNDEDIPDAPFRPVRLGDGQIFAMAAHYNNFSFKGKSFDSLRKNCRSVYRGVDDPRPEKFEGRVWLMSFWTNDGIRIAALGHNEYQASRFPGRCAFNSLSKCNYDSIRSFASKDAGTTFSPHSDSLVVAPVYAFDRDHGKIRGFLHPSNIIEFRSEYFALIQAMEDFPQEGGQCLIKTESPFSGVWKLLTREGWISTKMNPYDKNLPPTTPCMKLRGLEGNVWSILRHISTGMIIALTTKQSKNSNMVNLSVSVSYDLINWSHSQSFYSFVPAWSATCDNKERYSYPSLVDTKSNSPNFDTVGSDATLFLVKIHMNDCRMTLKRDLISIPVRLDWPGNK